MRSTGIAGTPIYLLFGIYKSVCAILALINDTNSIGLIVFINEKFVLEQVHLQVTHNQNAFPVYAKYSSEYHEARDKFAAEHPDLIGQVDSILSLDALRQDEISREIYWQGARDCLTMIKHFNQNSSVSAQSAAFSPSYRFTTSDRTLEQFLYAHHIRFIKQQKINGKTHWTYPWSPEVVRLLDEYNNLVPYKGGSVSNESTD